VTHDLAGLDGREVIDRLDQVAVDDRDAGLTASVKTDELELSDDT
jgi:hypothetical protein